jgi:hypothetical protein
MSIRLVRSSFALENKDKIDPSTLLHTETTDAEKSAARISVLDEVVILNNRVVIWLVKGTTCKMVSL